jgi:hypothetical protein
MPEASSSERDAMSTRAQFRPTTPLALLPALAENWWLMLLRGIVTTAFGILIFISGLPLRC